MAVVRGHDPLHAQWQWVVAEVDESVAGDGVLRRALDEAQLRDAPLRVLMAWQSRYTDIHDGNAVADGNRLARAHLDRRLAQWKKRYPDLDVQAVAVRGSTLNYLSKNADSIKLLVVGHAADSGNHGAAWAAGLRGAAQCLLLRVDLRTSQPIVSGTSGVSTSVRRALNW